MTRRYLAICFLAAALPLVFGCATGRSVYVDPSEVDEKGAQFGDTDMKIMSEEIVSDLMQAPFWLISPRGRPLFRSWVSRIRPVNTSTRMISPIR